MAGKNLQKKQQKKGLPLVWLLLVLILAVLIAGGIGSSAAKYTQSDSGQTMVKAPEFYFTSDLLSVEPQNYVLNSGIQEVDFTLRNRADELRVSEVPIYYTVKATSGGTITPVKGTLDAGMQSDVAVKLSNMQPGETYEVTATGNAGYSQTLKAVFTISDNEEDVYRNLEMSSDDYYMLLTVWTHNVKGNLTIVFPKDLIPDNTYEGMESVYNHSDGESKFTVYNFEKYSSQTYRFFYNGGTYSAGDFEVYVENGGNKYPARTASLP